MRVLLRNYIARLKHIKRSYIDPFIGIDIALNSPRLRTLPYFTEELTQVASLTRESPSDSGLPISQWT